MTDNSKVKSSRKPTEILAEEIIKFIEDIECLHETLPLTMALVITLTDDSHKKYDKFIKEHATDKKKKRNGKITFSIKVEDYKKVNELETQFKNFYNAKRLIPRQFVISLVSQYDSFLGKIIRFIYSIKPEILNSTEKPLFYTDLIKYDNITDIIEHIIEKEIESVIRKSHFEQFEWLTSKLKKPFNKDLECWPTFIELTERRNLFVHCDGKVSSQYLKICNDNKCPIEPNIKIGDELNVSNEYFEDAYHCIYEIGVKLAQVIWRILYNSESENPDANLNNIAFQLIDNKEYDLAIRLLDFFTKKEIKHIDEDTRLTLIINKAQAFKWMKMEDECQKLLSSENWTTREDKFKLVVAVLHDNFKSAYECMKRLKHDQQFHKSFYKDWPLFKKLRQEEKFKDIYKECYSEDFCIEKTTVKEQIIKIKMNQLPEDGIIN